MSLFDAFFKHGIMTLEAEGIFMKLEKARQVLLDKEKRSKYDHWRAGGFRNVIGFEEWMKMQNSVHTVSTPISTGRVY